MVLNVIQSCAGYIDTLRAPSLQQEQLRVDDAHCHRCQQGENGATKHKRELYLEALRRRAAAASCAMRNCHQVRADEGGIVSVEDMSLLRAGAVLKTRNVIPTRQRSNEWQANKTAHLFSSLIDILAEQSSSSDESLLSCAFAVFACCGGVTRAAKNGQ